MNLSGFALDQIERIVSARDDPETHPAGLNQPQVAISEYVSVSGKSPEFVYHVAHEQLGLGASFGNDSTWVESKGTGNMLNLFSVPVGCRVFGGMSVSYMLPFADLTFAYPDGGPGKQRLARALPSEQGEIHLHPAYQQREFIVGDGLFVLETFYVPRGEGEDGCGACSTVFVRNSTERPVALSIVVSIGLRGETSRDVLAAHDARSGGILAWNRSKPNWTRIFGASVRPDRYLASTDVEQACWPTHGLKNEIEGSGDLVGALQFDVLLMPGKSKKISCFSCFSEHGRKDARRLFSHWRKDSNLLKQTIEFYRQRLDRSVLQCPDAVITQGVAWAKTCLIRPLARYPIGVASTNDPGNSSNIVGRDSAWLVHGADFLVPEASRSVLRSLASAQRSDGLTPEYVGGLDGKTEDYGFNVNDATALFLMAAGHHSRYVRDVEFMRELLPSLLKAGDLILREIGPKGLVVCKANKIGPQGICGWRNVLQNEQITGAVTELNAECYAALQTLADICEELKESERATGYRQAAEALRKAMDAELIDPASGLYLRNIDLEGNRFSQATIDMVFPLFCGAASDATRRAVCERLIQPDFVTEGGLRVLPHGNPHYDPSEESGCLGGVWPGATWWFAMAMIETDPASVARWLSLGYRHYLENPMAYSTVPGQFSEWSDGETLVNRGMRLSPWEPPRFLWAAFEALAGIRPNPEGIAVRPALPPMWKWLAVANVPIGDQSVTYFLSRVGSKLEMHTAGEFQFSGKMHRHQALVDAPETLTSGLTSMAFGRDGDVTICIGSDLSHASNCPLLAHHLLDASKRYRVSSLVSPDVEWREIGCVHGSADQRLDVRIEPFGYALFRFSEA